MSVVKNSGSQKHIHFPLKFVGTELDYREMVREQCRERFDIHKLTLRNHENISFQVNKIPEVRNTVLWTLHMQKWQI